MSGLTALHTRALMLIGLCAAMPVTAATCDGAPWVRLEVIAGEMAGHQAAEWVEIDRDGCVISSFPSWDTRAGIYQRSMSATEQTQLATVLEAEQIMAFDAGAERRAIASASTANHTAANAKGKPGATFALSHTVLFAISDADEYRLMLDNGGQWKTIVWDSPRFELEQRRAITKQTSAGSSLDGLQRLVNVILAIQQVANNPAKTKIAEVAR